MNNVFCVASQKGGVGKTTTVLNLGLALAQKGRRVLLVDADPQGGIALCLEGQGSPAHDRRGLFHALSGEGDLRELARSTDVENVQVIDSGVERPGIADYEEAARAAGLFRELIQSASAQHDVVLVDCPPGVGVIPTSALVASDYVLVPLQCEPLGLRTLPQLLRLLIDVKQGQNHRLDLAGIVITMFDAMNTTSQVVAQQIRHHFDPDIVFRTLVPRDPALNVLFSPTGRIESVLKELHAFSIGLKAYGELADELEERFVHSAADLAYHST